VKPWRDDPRRGTGPAGGRRAGVAGQVADAAPEAAQTEREAPAGPPSVGIVGAGAVGTALGLAISRAGWRVAAFSSRDARRRERFHRLVPGASVLFEPASVLNVVDLAILAVPDDALASVCAPLRLYGGQSLVHTSGLLGAEVLEPARAAGAYLGAFHPLVSFTSDVEASADALRGATVAIEGDDRLIGLLADLAEAVGGVPVRLPPGSKAAYHAAATLASGGLIALLDAVAALGAAAGMDEPGTLAVYGRLVEQTLGNARRHGIAAALTGPITRGDAGTLEAHLDVLRRLAPGAMDLYVAAAGREIQIALERGSLTAARAGRLRASLAKAGRPGTI
jgi:predicted short-subunit dehydrogenase-like oxidoreductase (DUF2520 family)